jgi:hypothetical protein
MRRSQKFRPVGLVPLEDRVVMSHAPAAAAVIGAVQPGPKNQSPSPQNTVLGNVGNFNGKDIAQTIQAGDPVYENITTNFAATNSSTASTQGETRLIVPDKANNSVTTTRVINLRNHQGFEKIVDVATTDGNTTYHDYSITLPGGGSELGTETDVVQGNKTLQKGTTYLPGGSTQTFTATVTTSGNVQTTDQTTVSPDGFATTTHTVVTVKNELAQSTVQTVTHPDGTVTTSKSNTWVLRLQPPSS